MAAYDSTHGGYRVFVGNVSARTNKYDLEREFDRFGTIVDVWVARNPPGFAFLVFKNPEDAERAVSRMDDRTVLGRRLRVEHAFGPRKSRDGRRGGGRGGGFGGGRDRSRSPRRRRSRSRSSSRSSRRRSRSRSPVAKDSRSPSRSKSRSRSHSVDK